MAPVKRLIPLLWFLAACGNTTPPREFQEAFDALDKALAPERLENSAFAPRYPNPTAKQVVSYLLSEAGAEVLQVSHTPLREDIDFTSSIPVWPSGVRLWHSKPSERGKLYVILKWNDSTKVVIGEAYQETFEEPVYVKQWNVVPLTARKTMDPSDKREFQAF